MHFGQPAGSKGKTGRFRLPAPGFRQWTVVLMAGLLLAVIAMPVSENKKETSSAAVGAKEETRDETEEAGRYETELEARLAGILENVQGVGRVQVLIHTDGETGGEVFYSAGEQKVEGVLIVAEGADNSVIVQNIQQAVMSLFQLEAHKIKIMKMK